MHVVLQLSSINLYEYDGGLPVLQSSAALVGSVAMSCSHLIPCTCMYSHVSCYVNAAAYKNKKAVLPQGNRAMRVFLLPIFVIASGSVIAPNPTSYRRRSRREQQLAITAYVTRMGIMGNLLPDWRLQGRPSKSMGNGKIWDSADAKPMNRSSPNLNHVITSRTYHQEKLGVNPSRGFCPHIRENTPMATKFQTK